MFFQTLGMYLGENNIIKKTLTYYKFDRHGIPQEIYKDNISKIKNEKNVFFARKIEVLSIIY